MVGGNHWTLGFKRGMKNLSNCSMCSSTGTDFCILGSEGEASRLYWHETKQDGTQTAHGIHKSFDSIAVSAVFI